jgi:hypothetical protein
MKEETDDEHVHNDSSKELPDLLITLKSNSMTTTTIDKLFADGSLYEGNEIFRYLWEIMELPYCIKVRKRMLKLDGKKEETSLGIYQFWPRKMIYKSGKRTAA